MNLVVFFSWKSVTVSKSRTHSSLFSTGMRNLSLKVSYLYFIQDVSLLVAVLACILKCVVQLKFRCFMSVNWWERNKCVNELYNVDTSRHFDLQQFAQNHVTCMICLT